MKRAYLTPDDFNTITTALRVAAEVYGQDRRNLAERPETERLVEQFTRQQNDATALLATLEDVDNVVLETLED